MFHRIRMWLWSIGDSVVADQQREINSLRSQVTAADKREEGWAKTQAAVNETCREIKDERDTGERLLRVVLRAIGFESDSRSWTPAELQHSVGAHLDQLRSADVRRAVEAESAANDLRAELRAKERELEVEQNSHRKTTARAELAELERAKLADICERDRERIAAEKAVQIRKKAEAEAGTDAVRQDEAE